MLGRVMHFLLKKVLSFKVLILLGIISASSLLLWNFNPKEADGHKQIGSPEHLVRPSRKPIKEKMELLDLGNQRLVHLDLKGAPPKVSYLKELMPLLKEWGATGLLIEYEDTFPFDGEHLDSIGSSGSDSPGVYSKDQVTEIIGLAEENRLDVIPLVQTFGHLEFVLKHDKFRGLREVENFPGSICPSNSESLPLVQNMLEQVIKMHPNITMLHIGADEVWHLGVCSMCQARMATLGESAKDRIFLDHVVKVLRWLKEKYPYVQLLMWDDMLRHIDPLLLLEYELGKLVEPMVWHYRSSKSFQLSRDMWPMYMKVFKGIWVATAFKGASGPNIQLPMISLHLDCQERWLQELQIQHDRGTLPKIRGLALTGWSRYDHYAVMCELLPAGVPSLVLCLAQWQARMFSHELHKNVSRSIGYPEGQVVPLVPYPPHAVNKLSTAKFPGWEARHGIEWFAFLQAKVKSITDGDSVLDELAALESYLRPALEKIFTPMAVEEWLGTHLEPLTEQLKQLLQNAEHQFAVGGRTRKQKPNVEL